MFLLVTLATFGCATGSPKTVYLRPVCIPAEPAELPTMDAEILWRAVGPDNFYILQTREKLIVDWAIKNESILKSICEKPEGRSEGTYES